MTKFKKEEPDMQAISHLLQRPRLPIPKKEEKRLMQAEVNLDLFAAVEKEMERRNLKIRQVMEWGLQQFLLASNPKEAARLGIKAESA